LYWFYQIICDNTRDIAGIRAVVEYRLYLNRFIVSGYDKYLAKARFGQERLWHSPPLQMFRGEIVRVDWAVPVQPLRWGCICSVRMTTLSMLRLRMLENKNTPYVHLRNLSRHSFHVSTFCCPMRWGMTASC
jgi:hypothetical protein